MDSTFRSDAIAGIIAEPEAMARYLTDWHVAGMCWHGPVTTKALAVIELNRNATERASES